MVFIVIFIASFLLQLIAPWWIVVPIAFITCGLLAKTSKISLWAPFFAIFLLWVSMALLKSIPNNHLLATRVSEMLAVKSWLLVLVLMGILGGFAAGVSGICGYHFRKAVFKTKSNS